MSSDTNTEISNKIQMSKVHEKAPLSSLDLAFQFAKEAVDDQLEQIDKFDSKGDSTQSSATALIGAALVLEAVLLPSSKSLAVGIVQIALLLPLLIAYIIVMIYASKSYRISQYQALPHHKTLFAKYLDAPESVTKKRMLSVMNSAYEENEKKIKRKVEMINRAIMWRTTEAIILVVVLFIQVILVLFTGSSPKKVSWLAYEGADDQQEEQVGERLGAAQNVETEQVKIGAPEHQPFLQF